MVANRGRPQNRAVVILGLLGLLLTLLPACPFCDAPMIFVGQIVMDPPVAVVGQSIRVFGYVANRGDKDGDSTIELWIGETKIDEQKDVFVMSGGLSTPYEFRVTVDRPGKYSVTVRVSGAGTTEPRQLGYQLEIRAP